jgi:hypothetical protein
MDTPDERTYATWNNHLEDSNRRFTSIFTCPITGERFAVSKVHVEIVHTQTLT